MLLDEPPDDMARFGVGRPDSSAPASRKEGSANGGDFDLDFGLAVRAALQRQQDRLLVAVDVVGVRAVGGAIVEDRVRPVPGGIRRGELRPAGSGERFGEEGKRSLDRAAGGAAQIRPVFIVHDIGCVGRKRQGDIQPVGHVVDARLIGASRRHRERYQQSLRSFLEGKVGRVRVLQRRRVWRPTVCSQQLLGCHNRVRNRARHGIFQLHRMTRDRERPWRRWVALRC